MCLITLPVRCVQIAESLFYAGQSVVSIVVVGALGERLRMYHVLILRADTDYHLTGIVDAGNSFGDRPNRPVGIRNLEILKLIYGVVIQNSIAYTYTRMVDLITE